MHFTATIAAPRQTGRGEISFRDVAQPGRALALGARSREFESRRPDHLIRF